MSYAHQNNSYLDLDDLPSVVRYLQENQGENGCGTLHISELGVSVDYDLYNGRVGPITFMHTDHNVEVSYSDAVENALKQQVTKQIKEAISLLAKLYLLQRLLELGDPEITKIIQSRHIGVQ